MASKFAGNPDLVKHCLMMQESFLGDRSAIVDRIYEKGELLIFRDKQKIIEQGADDNDIYFILSGEVDIYVNKNYMYPREKRHHVGEMSLVSPDEKRSADVLTAGTVEVWKIKLGDFEEIAKSHPLMWRGVASEIAKRLRHRNSLIRPSNVVPEMFIGCASENLDYANELRSCFSHENVEVKIWTDKTVFPGGSITLTELQKRVHAADFAVMIWNPVDKTRTRGKNEATVRDNVVFEFGLFMGVLGNERCYYVYPRGQDVKMPSDFGGLNGLSYDPTKDIHGQMQIIKTEIMRVIQSQGVRKWR